MRNPQGVAAGVTVDTKRRDKNNNIIRAKLRSRIIEEILGEDMVGKLGCVNDFVMERDVASIHTMDEIKRRRMDRIAILDGDVSGVMRYAMNSEKLPRDIQEGDFDRCINGDKEFTDAGGGKQKILQEDRRKQKNIGKRCSVNFWEKQWERQARDGMLPSGGRTWE